MKAYIIYIATLLVALALPAAAQTDGPGTKAVPDVPAMPYRLSMTLTGGAHGKVTVAATKPGEATDVYIPLTADSLVYGVSDNNGLSGKNAAEVKITVIPDKFYEFRDGFPKVYPTGKPDMWLLTSVDDDATGNPCCTFRMPACPVTVEMAYAIQVDSLLPINLKDKAANIDSAVALLPAYVPVSLADGRKDSLKVAGTNGWVLNGSSFDSKPGVRNEFKVSFTLPDSLYKATTFKPLDQKRVYWDYIYVTNKAESLKSDDVKDKDIFISAGTSGNLIWNTQAGGDVYQVFNGTIEDANVKSLKIAGNVNSHDTLTLKDFTVSCADDATKAKFEVESGADLIIRVEGSNDLGTFLIGTGVSLSLIGSDTLQMTEVVNAGTFYDNTATITSVTGPGALSISSKLEGGGSTEINRPVTLTAHSDTVTYIWQQAKADMITFIWQQVNADSSYTEVRRQTYDNLASDTLHIGNNTGITDEYKPTVTAVGSSTYRCLIERIVTSSVSSAVTLLSTKQTTVTVTSTTDPDPAPIYYTVILPKLTGATLTPTSAVYMVGAGEDFRFTLTLDKDYDLSKPVVTTDREETLSLVDGIYTIGKVNENVDVTITGIVKNSNVSNAEVTGNDIRVWGNRGMLHISQPTDAEVKIYTFGGTLLKTVRLPAGNSQTAVPAGNYVVVAGDGNSFKVFIK